MPEQPDDIGRHELVKRIFLGVCARSPGDVAAFLDEACGGDTALRAEVESLLAFQSKSPSTRLADSRERPTARAPVATVREDAVAPWDGVVGRMLSGRYDVHGELGRGGMGQVYLATDKRFGKQVAVKAMLLESDVMRRAFEREAKLLNVLRHAALPVVTDYFTERDRYFLVMDFVPGRDLGDVLARRLRAGEGPFPVADVLRWADQLLDALTYLHTREPPVVHRDIKPQNVKLTSRGDAMLLDFGLAKGSGDGNAGPLASLAGYTPYYAPLEQMRGAGTDPRSDLYSLGAALYHLLTGEVPADACVRAEALLAGSGDPLVPANKARGDLPGGLAETLAAALAISRNARPASAEVMRDALRSASSAASPVESDPGGMAAPRSVDTALHLGAPKTKVRTPTIPNNLPRQTTGFVGRDAEVDHLVRLNGVERLVTIVGPGGIGKTRLAQHAASELLGSYPDGVWLVELVSSSEPGHVASSVAAATAVREEPGRQIAESLVDALRARRMLLLLDNCEHVVEACASLASRLLQMCPDVRLIATSREPLGVGGEVVWQAPPMALPDTAAGPDDVRESEAVRLFVDRARLARQSFNLDAKAARIVVDICRRLDGIPLAIELAAARLKVLTLEQISSRLDDRFRLLTGGGREAPERQQTLRAAVDWSYRLLTDDERAVLRCLSMFPAGCTVEAVEAVAGRATELSASPRPDDVLDLVSHLVDKSLVVVEERAGEARYRMLDTIREFAVEKLHDAGEFDAMREALSAWVLDLADSGAKGVNGPDQPLWVARLDAEHDNVRSVLRTSLDSAESREDGMRIANAMLRFWTIRGFFAEGRAWFEEIVARCEGTSPVEFSDALSGAGICATSQGDLASARVYHDRALAIAREVADPRRLFRVLNNLAIVAVEAGDYEGANEAMAEALACARLEGNERTLSLALSNLGTVNVEMGEYERAVPLFEEALVLKRRIGERASIGYTLTGLGFAVAFVSEPERGQALVEEALALFREVGERRGESAALVRLARLLTHVGTHAPDALGRARAMLADSFGIRRQIGDVGSMAEVLEELSILASSGGESERALRLAGAAEVLRSRSATNRGLFEARRLEESLAEVRSALGADARRFLDEGRRLTLDEVAALAWPGSP